MNTKKCLVVLLGLAISIPAVSGISLAVETASNQQRTVTITDTNGASGATLILEMSPGVLLTYTSTVNEFALSSSNENAQWKYRLEYGIWSPVAGYYQVKNPSVADPVVTLWDASLTVGTDPFGAFKYMGNN